MRHQEHGLYRQVMMISLLSTTLIAAAYGQEQKTTWNYRGEVLGQVGWGSFYHGDHKIGSGAEWGGSFGVKPFSGKLRRLGFEFQANRLDLAYERGVNINDGQATAVVGNVLYHFSDSPIQPYVAGGLGILKADYTEVIKGGAVLGSNEDYVSMVKADKMLLNIGAGVKARLIRGLAIRPEIRFYDTTIGSGYNFGSIRLSVGVGYYW